MHAAEVDRPRLGRSRRRIRCRRSGTRSRSSARWPTCGRGPTRSAPSPACATASAARSTSSSRRKASSTSTRRSSPPATAKAPARCSASRTLDPAKPPRNADGKVDYAQDFFGKPAYLTVSGQLEGEIYAMRARQDLHLRPDVPRRELEHVAAPGRVLDGRARDGVLRARRQHGPGRAVPQAHLSATCWPTARRTCSSSTSASTTRCIDTLEERRRPASSSGCRYTEAIEILEEVGREVRVPGRVGQRPAGRARALPHREEVQRPVILYDYPRDDQSRSTCG